MSRRPTYTPILQLPPERPSQRRLFQGAVIVFILATFAAIVGAGVYNQQTPIQTAPGHHGP